MARGNKRRRIDASSSSTTLRSNSVNVEKPSLTRLNELISEAVQIAKAIQPVFHEDWLLIKEAHILKDSLLKALPVDSTDIKYEEHEPSIRKDVQELEFLNSRPGENETIEYLISKLAERLNQWLAHIWRCMQHEDLVDMNLVEKSFVLCSEGLEVILDCCAREECTLCTMHHTTVVDAGGKVVYDEYYGRLIHNMAWMWRELLVVSTSRNLPTHSIIKNIRRFRLLEDVLNLLRRQYDEDAEAEENDEGYGFWDGHWTNAMKVAATDVLSCLVRI
ncbi:hypothetical protein CPC08DRAFT_769111 [Agrocybe pediades]|nr:hypothetical protein CPC08DRAFT_769111 [Agrocybe pediades]